MYKIFITLFQFPVMRVVLSVSTDTNYESTLNFTSGSFVEIEVSNNEIVVNGGEYVVWYQLVDRFVISIAETARDCLIRFVISVTETARDCLIRFVISVTETASVCLIRLMHPSLPSNSSMYVPFNKFFFRNSGT